MIDRMLGEGQWDCVQCDHVVKGQSFVGTGTVACGQKRPLHVDRGRDRHLPNSEYPSIEYDPPSDHFQKKNPSSPLHVYNSLLIYYITYIPCPFLTDVLFLT